MGEDATTIAQSEWSNLFKELARRTIEPWQSVPFVIFAIVGALILGGLGIWTELTKIALAETPHVDLANLLTAITTFFPALVGSAALQLIFAAVNKQDKAMSAFASIVLFVFFIAAILISLFSTRQPAYCVAIGSIISFGAVWFWWITNGDDPLYRKISPDAPTGGPTNRSLSGNLEGYLK